MGFFMIEEQMRAEHDAEKQLEQKVARMLSHEIDVEKGIQVLNSEIAHTVHDINKHLRGLEHQQFMDNMYWSRKGGCCMYIIQLNVMENVYKKQQMQGGGGGAVTQYVKME